MNTIANVFVDSIAAAGEHMTVADVDAIPSYQS